MCAKSVYAAFTAGEVSEEFFSRTDLARFNYGAALAENYFVDYRGGMISRHGYEYVFPCPNGEGLPRFFRFVGTTVDFLLVFSDTRMRVVRNGGYLLEAAKNIIGVSNGVGCIVSSTAHGYSVGDLVFISGVVGTTELNGRYFKISATTANNFTIQSPDGEVIDSTNFGAYISGGTVARAYTLTVPYSTGDLPNLNFEQKQNDIYVTSDLYPSRKITYVSDLSWSIALVDFFPSANPSGLSLAASAAGTAGAAYAVTAVKNGVESPRSGTTLIEVARRNAGDSVRAKWTSVPGTEYYNVYRSVFVATGAEITRGDTLGYIGQTPVGQFTDNLIDPDFTKVPPRTYTPFTPGAIASVRILTRGTGYAKNDGVTVTDPDGTGANVQLAINTLGEIIGVIIFNSGSGYTSPSLSISTAGGSGATFEITVNPLTGVYPRLYKTFQQRGIWAATQNNPVTLWGSRPGAPENLFYSDILRADDAYIYTLDVDTVKPIKHLVAIRSGLLLFTESGVVQLLPSSGKVITPLNATAEDQAFLPVSDVEPLQIGLDVLFTEKDGAAVQAMQYTEYTETFQLQDIAVLSSHLLNLGRRPTKMVYWSSPHKLIYLLREDGKLALCTYDRSQEIFGWATQVTKGYYRDIEIVRETAGETPYVLVERFVNGAWRYFGERAKTRLINRDEDAFCVDCGLTTNITEGTATLTFSDYSGPATATLSGGTMIFTPDWIGRILYAGDGKFEITGYVSGTQMTGTFLRPLPEDEGYSSPRPYSFPPLSWSYGTPTTVIQNLWHLEGETVSVQADGDGFIDKVVSNGQITLDFLATKVVVGLAYHCDLKTLPLTNNQVMIEGEDKRVMGLHFRRLRSRGLFIGPEFDNLQEVKERGDVPWGDSLGLVTGVEEISLSPGFDYDSHVCFRQSWPLPCTILGLVFDIEVTE